MAQPADALPIIKYVINNYSSLSKAVSGCDTCQPVVGKALQQFRPIPFPPTAAINLIPGVDINQIPGIAAPNFIGGGSPEIKGLVKKVAGMTDFYANNINRVRSDMLYFRSGAQGVAVSKSGKIFTSSSTIMPGAKFDNPYNVLQGFFSFKSTPQRIPAFNSRSEETFYQSPDKVVFEDEEIANDNTEIAYFALHPANENIVYAAFKNTENDTKILARKSRAGNWEKLDWDLPGGVGLAKSVWGALAVDKDGNLYVADATQHVIVKVTFDDAGKANSWQIIGGQMDTPGFVNDNDALDARFNTPSGICIDNAGNIYISDAGNNVIRKIDNDGEVTTYAGNGEKGFTDDDNWEEAKFWGPTALAYNETSKALFVVDYGNKLIREINDKREVSTLAGNAGSLDPRETARFAMTLYYWLAALNMDPDEAKLDDPTGIAIDPSGYGLYVSDGKYIKYVNTSETIFTITAAIGDPRANVLGLPILPPGIKMNSSNGSFYGTPVALLPWQPTTYTISITNHVTSGSLLPPLNGFITFEVVACPEKTDTVIVNKTISRNELPFTWNKIVLNGAGTASVTSQTLLGCDSVTVLNLSISPELNYNSEPYILSFGQLIKPIVPTTAGSKIQTFSVSPSLPTGLTLNAQSGEISGTPLAYTTTQLVPAVGPQTPPQYPAPWTLEAGVGADLTEFKISDGNQKTVFENNSAFNSLVGTAGPGTGTAGAYTDFSGLGAIKLFSNSPYSVRLSNALFSPGREYDNLNYTRFARETFNYMNSYAVYIDYNRDGDFADAGERVYISGGPQSAAHAESFDLNIPLSAKPGVTKMRIYAVEAKTAYQLYLLDNGNGGYNSVYRSTEQALSFYPFFNDISYDGETYFTYNMNYGEFEDYNIDIVSPVTQSYVVTGSNAFGSAQSTIKLAVNKPTTSSTNLTICSTELPYRWNKLTFYQADTKTDTLRNMMGADSLATLNLTVKQASSSVVSTEYCGPYTYQGKVYTESNEYAVHITNAVGCDSSIIFRFRQKANASTTNLEITPALLPYKWNGLTFNTAGTQSAKLTNKEGCDSTATLVLRVAYNITYTTNNLLTLNRPITPLTPRIEGGYTPPGLWYNEYYGYSIVPTLPSGLQLDPVTGIISGTPTQLSALQTYNITLNQDGAKPATISLSVGMPSASTTTIDNCGPYTWNGVLYDKAGTATYLSKNQYGYDSTATLILSIRNPSATTVKLFLAYSELPYTWNETSITDEGDKTVHLVNAVGCDSAVTAEVVVSPKIFYVSPQLLQPNQPIAAITPQNVGGNAVNYTIQPSLVKGLLFDEATGVISGTPADTLLQPVTHTIQAFNGAGSDNAKLVVAVCNTMATSFTVNTCDQYIWNDSTYTTSTTHTRTLKNRGGCDSVVTMNLFIRKRSTGPTTAVTACGNYVWYGVNYEKTGVYTKVFPNAVGCDSTIYLNLTIKNPTVNNLYVNLNQSDLPYTWRGKTFAVQGTQSIVQVNSVGCDSTLSMTVKISDVLPDISYGISDTILYWERKIETPITMSNTGTPVPAAKLGERDTLIAFSNGPGDHIKTIKGPDGAYYARVFNSSKIYKLSSSGAWIVFAELGGAVKAMDMDKLGNLYVGISETRYEVRKITPEGVVSTLPGFSTFSGINALAVDAENNLIIQTQLSQNLIRITRLNLSTNQSVQTQMDNPYFDFGPEDMKTDSKGNIYMYPNMGNGIVKIRPSGQMVGIGRNWSSYYEFQPGNGTDAMIPSISSMAIDPSNDNVYLMAYGYILRVDTAGNVAAVTGSWFDQYRDQIFRVDNGKISIVNNSTGILYTANVYGVGSLPFIDNYGVNGIWGPQDGTVNFKDLDKRIRLDSSGAIVGTARAKYSSIGTIYASNNSTEYSIIAANRYGISKASMVITTKSISYKRENFVTTSLPFVWRGRSFNAATDTATYFVANKTLADDTLYMLHLVYEGPPQPIITSNCVTGGVSLTANGAAKNAIRFDGTNMGLIKNVQSGGGSGLGYYGADYLRNPDNSWKLNFHSSFEVWIKPESVSGTQYLLTRDTVKTHGTFFGYSIQEGKFVYEFMKGSSPLIDYKLSSFHNIEKDVWTHVAASYYDSTMYIFINGKLEGSLQTADRFINPFYPEAPGSSVLIFPDFCLAGLGSQSGYKGEMDELRLWGTRRNADSIKATMNTIVDPSSAGLGLYYRFDGAIKDSATDIASSNHRAVFIKPATSVSVSGAPINFASYKWMPRGDTVRSIVANPVSNTLYTLTVTDYKGTSGSNSLLVYPAQGPTITAPAAVTRTNSPSSCAVLISDADLGSAVALDNCPGLIVKRTGIPAGNVFPVGVTTITYTATNAAGLTKAATQTVTVTDVTKPAFTTNLSANPVVIWPPDHKLKNIALTYTTSDNCAPVTNKVTVTSTDPINGVSDGDLSPDWTVSNDHLVQLRAERGNGKEARIYTITVTPVDASGNAGTPQSVNIYIAHNITAPITGSSFKIGSTVDFSGVFWDMQGNKHTGEWVIDDNTTVKGTVTEPVGTKNGKVTGSYKFTTAGIYKLQMNITDQNKLTSYCNTNEDMEAIVVVYDPGGGYSYGGGWFTSPAGALQSDATATGKVNFGYNVSYFKGASNPKGETQFEFKVGGLEFNALNFDYLSIQGAKAQFKGTGKITGGQSGINFVMTVIDGALDGTGIDKVRIKIYNKNTGQVYYDNEPGSSDAANPVTKVGANSQVVIGGGNITSGSTTAPIAMSARISQDQVNTVTKLQAQVFPNPSYGQFMIAVRGRVNEQVTIRVTDVLGRFVEVRKDITGSGTLTLGASYRPGLYIAEVLQGKEKVVLKLLKQTE